jgi:hypothetical protein
MYLQSTAALSNASSPSNSSSRPLTAHSQTPSQDLLTSPASSVFSSLSPASATSSPVQLTAPGSAILVGPPSSRTRARVINLLSEWHFEPYRLSSSEMLLAVQLLFEAFLTALDLPWQTQAEKSAKDTTQGQNGYHNPTSSEPRITMERNLIPFIHDLAKMYRRDNKYHSFIHALDVLQAVYMFLEREGRVPNICILLSQDSVSDGLTKENEILDQWRKRRREQQEQRQQNQQVVDGNSGEEKPAPSAIELLSDADIFLLGLAAIGHDVGHPGNSNAFLVSKPAIVLKP